MGDNTAETGLGPVVPILFPTGERDVPIAAEPDCDPVVGPFECALYLECPITAEVDVPKHDPS